MSFLGFKGDSSIAASSLIIALILIFYIFFISSFLEVKVYSFQNRVTYENLFITHITTSNLDVLILLSSTLAWIYFASKDFLKKLIIMLFFSSFVILFLLNYVDVARLGALLTLPFITSVIIIERFSKYKIFQYDAELSINYISITMIGFAIWGIVSLLIFISTGIPIAHIEKFPYAIFQEILSILTPIIIIVLIFCVPFKVLLIEFLNKRKVNTKFLMITISSNDLRNKETALYLFLIITLAVCIAWISHLPVINPNNERLGVDTPRYLQWLMILKNQTTNTVPLIFVEISSGDRPLTLAILFLITEMIPADSLQVLEHTPLILSPILILSTFVLTRELTRNDKISLLAAFMSAISFQTLIGIYSGFYANWMALILGYLAFALIVRCLKSPSKLGYAGLLIVMIGVLLAHVYTWSIVIAIAFIFLIVLHVLHYYPRKKFLVLYLILSSSIIADILRSSLTDTSGLEADLSVGIYLGFGSSQFAERFKTLVDIIQTYFGGAYANIAILGLVLIWLIRCRIREMVNIFMIIFLSSALVPLFIGDWVLQSRVLYNIPFQIPAAISVYTLWTENHRIICIAMLLIAAYVSLHFLANLGYVPPGSPLTITH